MQGSAGYRLLTFLLSGLCWARSAARFTPNGTFGGRYSICGAEPRVVLKHGLDCENHFYQTRNMEEHSAIASLSALAQPMRLRIFRALVGSAPQGMTPGALSAMLDVPASTLSFHLKELTHSGLVTQERESRHLIYRPSIEQMNELLGYLTSHCCQGVPCGVSAGSHD